MGMGMGMGQIFVAGRVRGHAAIRPASEVAGEAFAKYPTELGAPNRGRGLIHMHIDRLMRAPGQGGRAGRAGLGRLGRRNQGVGKGQDKQGQCICKMCKVARAGARREFWREPGVSRIRQAQARELSGEPESGMASGRGE
jgi:hypothetical protein